MEKKKKTSRHFSSTGSHLLFVMDLRQVVKRREKPCEEDVNPTPLAFYTLRTCLRDVRLFGHLSRHLYFSVRLWRDLRTVCTCASDAG